MILVFASGSGSNFAALADTFPSLVTGLVCNQEGAPVLTKASSKNIPTYVVPHKNFSTRVAHEQAIIAEIFALENIKLVVLAGYMRVVTEYFLDALKNLFDDPLVINLHPAYLDQYRGAHAYEYVVRNKFNSSALSVHKVTKELDAGPLLHVQQFPIFPYETVTALRQRVKALEHQTLICAVSKILGNNYVNCL